MLHESRTRYRFKEACAVIGCSHVFLRREIRRGALGPVVKVNARVIWITASAIEAYRRTKTVGSSSPAVS